MESANLHHHQRHQLQVQDQLVIGSSPLSTSNPCFFGAVGIGNTTHSWPPNTLLNPSSHFSTSNIANGSVIVNSRDISRQQNDFLAPSLNNSSMNIQGMGFQWASSNTNNKEELSYPYHQKFTELMINHGSPSPSSSSNTPDFQLHQQPTISYTKNEERELREMSEKHLLRNFSSGCQIKGLQFQAGNSNRGSFSQILPTINLSNLNRSNSSSGISSSLDMNMQPLELFTPDCRFSAGCLCPAANDIHGFYKDNLYYGVDNMQQSRPSNSHSKISAFTSGVSSEAKRPSSYMEPKVTHSAQKKSRSDSRSSCPPIKVRKEKLGDRIAALQQLVAPFGKTDTASVLMEAIGYIKFLQNQVETLSVPYMKTSRNRTGRTMRGGSSEDGHEESKPDLRSRGLCLVPLTCLSYVTDGGGGVWPAPNFG